LMRVGFLTSAGQVQVKIGIRSMVPQLSEMFAQSVLDNPAILASLHH